VSLIAFNGGLSIYHGGGLFPSGSRIMTEQGGDIVMWSSNGSIDAGKGAKTSYSLPVPVFDIDNDFYVAVDAKGLVTGAGIATLQTVEVLGYGGPNDD
jgi:Filamentous haemagglutinin family outer membrane protein